MQTASNLLVLTTLSTFHAHRHCPLALVLDVNQLCSRHHCGSRWQG